LKQSAVTWICQIFNLNCGWIFFYNHSWCQFHQHYTRAFCADIFAPKNVKPKTQVVIFGAKILYKKRAGKTLMKLTLEDLEFANSEIINLGLICATIMLFPLLFFLYFLVYELLTPRIAKLRITLNLKFQWKKNLFIFFKRVNMKNNIPLFALMIINPVLLTLLPLCHNWILMNWCLSIMFVVWIRQLSLML